ncbi:GSCOCG00002764001-RA-CDS [Cotesia congregata]|uniref:Similar to FAM177A1: Protein FAM177A1 (Bos taurus) n=1 Tax=Cotesia congregata TaxID=51543 RepID=A0A8J2MNW8_COTCN|nr:GSCOCG00002764001-RA-CDS [Cotesia congregata]CAG5097731.1 Similar to FAM177A1: Protein FAM177A1 (Bos taurus) [Cotesia congregata]
MTTENKEMCDLTNVVLQVNGENQINQDNQSLKIPKRVLHFSDGDLIEYSDDETDSSSPETDKQLIDLKNIGWVPWTWYQTSWVGSKVLESCDYVGEALANFLGITSPKYYFELVEYQRLQKLQDEENKKDLEIQGWNQNNTETLIVNDIKTSNH